MESKVLLAEIDQVLPITKALNSELRLRIIEALQTKTMNVKDLAEKLEILRSTCTMNVQILEEAGLIETETVPAARGSQKKCRAPFSEIVLPLREGPSENTDKIISINMPVGLYTDFKIHPSCGIVSDEKIIDYLDSEQAFFSPARGQAQLIWFTDGFVEYSFPVNIQENQSIKALQITAEVCSEFPGYLEKWPSDITLWINSVEVGTWTSPGDMGGKRGRFTPSWWGLENTQFGFLKTWTVTNRGSSIDGTEISPITLEDLHILGDYRIRVRLGIKEDSPNRGGLNIFGEKFGNHPIGIQMKMEIL